MSFKLKFSLEEKIITSEMLNKEYGEYGRTFTNEQDALNHKKNNEGSFMYRLFDYSDLDVYVHERIGVANRDANKKYIGWLVTTPKNHNDNIIKIY